MGEISNPSGGAYSSAKTSKWKVPSPRLPFLSREWRLAWSPARVCSECLDCSSPFLCVFAKWVRTLCNTYVRRQLRHAPSFWARVRSFLSSAPYRWHGLAAPAMAPDEVVASFCATQLWTHTYHKSKEQSLLVNNNAMYGPLFSQ
jgi:hypothetical protein